MELGHDDLIHEGCKEDELEKEANVSTALSDCGNMTERSSKRGEKGSSMEDTVAAADLLILSRLPLYLNKPDDELADVFDYSDDEIAGKEEFALGKRGRRYTDMWDEEDYLNKCGQDGEVNTAQDWSHLLRSYSDTHDGAYIDWSICDLKQRESALKREQKCWKKTRSISSSSEAVTTAGGTDFTYLHPPVPSAIFHPSCWGIESRRSAAVTFNRAKERNYALGVDVSRGRNPGVFDIIHPASLSRSIVELPGTAAVRDQLSDIDDLSLHAERLVREMHALEAANYFRLRALSGLHEAASQINSVRLRGVQLSDTLALMYNRNELEYQSSDRHTFTGIPTPLKPVPIERPPVSAPIHKIDGREVAGYHFLGTGRSKVAGGVSLRQPAVRTSMSGSRPLSSSSDVGAAIPANIQQTR